MTTYYKKIKKAMHNPDRYTILLKLAKEADREIEELTEMYINLHTVAVKLKDEMP